MCKWRAFGNGGGGDMGCHTTNLAFRALRLDLLWNPDPAARPAAPAVIRVEAQASEIHAETYPEATGGEVRFPGRGKLPPVKLTWYNGGPKPPKDVLLGHIMTAWGCLVKGSQGAVFTSCPWNTRLELLPKEKFQEFKGPAPTLPRRASHHAEWIAACKGGPQPFSSFDIGGPMTEIVQLVHVASLAGKPIEYDPLSGRIVNCPRPTRCSTAPIARPGPCEKRFNVAGTLRVPSAVAEESSHGRHTECACYFPGCERIQE